jgi:hypothetical protein
MRRTEGDRQRRQDLADIASGHHARLLPWTTEGGKPCFLSTHSGSSMLSRLADEMETVQLSMGAEVLDHARRVMDDPKASVGELRYAGVHLIECLRDVLRVAESRGMRLPVPDSEEDESDAESPAEVSA